MNPEKSLDERTSSFTSGKTAKDRLRLEIFAQRVIGTNPTPPDVFLERPPIEPRPAEESQLLQSDRGDSVCGVLQAKVEPVPYEMERMPTPSPKINEPEISLEEAFDYHLDINPDEDPFDEGHTLPSRMDDQQGAAVPSDFLRFLRGEADTLAPSQARPNDVVAAATDLIQSLQIRAPEPLSPSRTAGPLNNPPEIPTLNEVFGVSDEFIEIEVSASDQSILSKLSAQLSAPYGTILFSRSFNGIPPSPIEVLISPQPSDIIESLSADAVDGLRFQGHQPPALAVLKNSLTFEPIGRQEALHRRFGHGFLEGWFSDGGDPSPILTHLNALIQEASRSERVLVREAREVREFCSKNGLSLSAGTISSIPVISEIYNRTGVLVGRQHLRAEAEEQPRLRSSLLLQFCHLLLASAGSNEVSFETLKLLVVLDKLLTPSSINEAAHPHGALLQAALDHPHVSVLSSSKTKAILSEELSNRFLSLSESLRRILAEGSLLSEGLISTIKQRQRAL